MKLVLLTGMIAVMVIVTGSRGAFSATTDAPAGDWSAGTVTIEDDDASMPMFSARELRPGEELVQCITVTYRGSLTPAEVRLYTSGLAGTGLERWLDISIETGRGGGFGTCQDFEPESSIFEGAVAQLSERTDYASGLPVWQPVPDETLTLRFIVVLRDDQGAQGRTASLDVVWEAQNH